MIEFCSNALQNHSVHKFKRIKREKNLKVSLMIWPSCGLPWCNAQLNNVLFLRKEGVSQRLVRAQEDEVHNHCREDIMWLNSLRAFFSLSALHGRDLFSLLLFTIYTISLSTLYHRFILFFLWEAEGKLSWRPDM